MNYSKKELEEQFEWWITCIPDKIERLSAIIPKDVFDKLDFSVASFDVIEKFLINHFTIDDIQKNIELWDCIASYLGTTYKRNVPSSEWYVELDNKKNLFYGKPTLRIPNKCTFEPHSFVTRAIAKKEFNFLSRMVSVHNSL